MRSNPTWSMGATIAATDEPVRSCFGDVDLGLLTTERDLEWLTWLLRLPRLHGTSHSKNRHASEGRTIAKQAEIAEADLQDEVAIEEARAIQDMAVQQKRAILAEVSVPRMTVATVRKHRHDLARVTRALAPLGVTTLKIPSCKTIDTCVATLAKAGRALRARDET